MPRWLKILTSAVTGFGAGYMAVAELAPKETEGLSVIAIVSGVAAAATAVANLFVTKPKAGGGDPE